jgi:hypothetical protein
MPICSTVKNSKVEGKDLRKSESGVMRFMRCKRGGGGVVYIPPNCLHITGWMAPG